MKSSKLPVLILSLMFFVVGLFLGMSFQKVRDNRVLQATKEDFENNIKNINEEFDLAIDDRGKFLSSVRAPYTNEWFGIYSPLFEGKEMVENVYKYKKSVITERTIELGIEGNQAFGISVWEFGGKNENTQVIFDGYENYALHANKISDVASERDGSYTSSEKMKFNWNYGYAPRLHLVAVYLESLSRHYKSGNSIFIRLYYNNLYAPDKNDASVLRGMEKLKEVADTIPYRKPSKLSD